MDCVGGLGGFTMLSSLSCGVVVVVVCVCVCVQLCVCMGGGYTCPRCLLRVLFLPLPGPRVKGVVGVVVRLWRPLLFPPSICSTVE